jgi:D-alanyl-lipoteichoic acid acyltransferase DltB (MBOAT superfamily)
MTVFQLGVFALVAVIIGQLKKGRELAMLAVSVFILYWLQPAQQFVSLTFWIPTLTLALTILIWLVTSPPESRTLRDNWPAVVVIASVILLVDLNQYFGLEKIYMTSTPRLWMIALAFLAYLILLIFIKPWQARPGVLLSTALIGILLLFIYLKTPFLIERSFEFIYTLRNQESPSRFIFSWLGFSYIAFRLIHTIRDAQTGRLPSLTLGEYVNYVIFFPSFTAGPIDRVERFVPELREPAALSEQDWLEAGRRFFIGMFKKFVIADSLALIAISEIMVDQVHSAAWMWFFLYVYSLRIYFDFSGYTDVAIGLARVMGIRLPENFDAPYFKSNLTLFWNSWHITLTQWFRAYFFNPLTRWMRTGNYSIPVIIFVTQISTMSLIGLWHGVSWNFLLWGIWHGLGLFIQNRWSEFMRTRMDVPPHPRRQLLLNSIGIFLTFNFVSLGWLFFTLPSPQLALIAMTRLFGVAP